VQVVADLGRFADNDPMPWSMKTRRPMVAPGWISIPVKKRPKWVSQGPAT
jgi:hypothetical protein